LEGDAKEIPEAADNPETLDEQETPVTPDVPVTLDTQDAPCGSVGPDAGLSGGQDVWGDGPKAGAGGRAVGERTEEDRTAGERGA
jgi:hypothetical protein